jgi:hypothetical protein
MQKTAGIPHHHDGQEVFADMRDMGSSSLEVAPASGGLPELAWRHYSHAFRGRQSFQGVQRIRGRGVSEEKR